MRLEGLPAEGESLALSPTNELTAEFSDGLRLKLISGLMAASREAPAKPTEHAPTYLVCSQHLNHSPHYFAFGMCAGIK